MVFQPHPKKSVPTRHKLAFALAFGSDFAFGSAFALALTFALASPLAFWRVFGTPGKSPSGSNKHDTHPSVAYGFF